MRSLCFQARLLEKSLPLLVVTNLSFANLKKLLQMHVLIILQLIVDQLIECLLCYAPRTKVSVMYKVLSAMACLFEKLLESFPGPSGLAIGQSRCSKFYHQSIKALKPFRQNGKDFSGRRWCILSRRKTV